MGKVQVFGHFRLLRLPLLLPLLLPRLLLLLSLDLCPCVAAVCVQQFQFSFQLILVSQGIRNGTRQLCPWPGCCHFHFFPPLPLSPSLSLCVYARKQNEYKMLKTTSVWQFACCAPRRKWKNTCCAPVRPLSASPSYLSLPHSLTAAFVCN